MSWARKISTSSFPRSRISRNVKEILTDPRIDKGYVLFCSVHNKQSVEGET